MRLFGDELDCLVFPTLGWHHTSRMETCYAFLVMIFFLGRSTWPKSTVGWVVDWWNYNFQWTFPLRKKNQCSFFQLIHQMGLISWRFTTFTFSRVGFQTVFSCSLPSPKKLGLFFCSHCSRNSVFLGHNLCATWRLVSGCAYATTKVPLQGCCPQNSSATPGSHFRITHGRAVTRLKCKKS